MHTAEEDPEAEVESSRAPLARRIEEKKPHKVELHAGPPPFQGCFNLINRHPQPTN